MNKSCGGGPNLQSYPRRILKLMYQIDASEAVILEVMNEILAIA